jgi:hypothetical protein
METSTSKWTPTNKKIAVIDSEIGTREASEENVAATPTTGACRRCQTIVAVRDPEREQSFLISTRTFGALLFEQSNACK